VSPGLISLAIVHPLSSLESLCGSEHPDPDFRSVVPQHNQD